MENTKELSNKKQCDIHVVRRSFFDEFNYPLDKVDRKWLRRTFTVILSLLIMPIGALIGLCEITSKWYKDYW